MTTAPITILTGRVSRTRDPAASRGVVVREIAPTATRNAMVVVRLDYQGMCVKFEKLHVNPVDDHS